MTSPPWEPPLAGSEVAHLLGALDRLRATFRWKVDGLDRDGLSATVGRSTLTLGGLLKHLAFCEDLMFTVKLDGADLAAPWNRGSIATTQGWAFASAALDEPADLYGLWDDAVARSRRRVDDALAQGGLDQPAHISDRHGNHASLRRLLFDMVEEYGRHTGHADLLREAVDGRTGEDPPDDWRPSTN